MSATILQAERLITELSPGEREDLFARLERSGIRPSAEPTSDPTWVAFASVLDRLAAAPGPSMVEELINSRR